MKEQVLHLRVEVGDNLAAIHVLFAERPLQLECACHVVREQLYQSAPACWLR